MSDASPELPPADFVERYAGNPVLTPDDVPYPCTLIYNAAVIRTDNAADFSSTSNGLIFGGADSAYSALTFAPGNPNIIYVGSGYEDDRFAKGIFKSTDGGKSWNAISDGLSRNPATGQPHYVKSITIHPTHPDIVWAATGGGLFKTVNGGGNWVQQ